MSRYSRFLGMEISAAGKFDVSHSEISHISQCSLSSWIRFEGGGIILSATDLFGDTIPLETPTLDIRNGKHLSTINRKLC